MRIEDKLKRRLEGVRGDLLLDEEFADVRCRETSDSTRLCVNPVVSVQNLHTSTHLMRRTAMDRGRKEFEDAYRWRLRQGDVTQLFTIAAVSDVCFLGDRCSVYRMNDGGVTRSVGARSLMDGDFLKIYFCMKVFGWPFEMSFAAFADLLVNRWIRIAREGTAEDQRRLAQTIGRSSDLRMAFSRWYCRGFFRALAAGALTERRYRLLRPLFAFGAHLNKWGVRRELKMISGS